VQPLRAAINAKGGDCWQVWQEGVCLSLMERTKGKAKGSEWTLKLRRVNE